MYVNLIKSNVQWTIGGRGCSTIMLTYLLPLLQQHLQSLRRLLGLILLTFGVVLALRVVEVDAEVEGDVDQRRHQLHRYSTETSDVTHSASARELCSNTICKQVMCEHQLENILT